MRRFILNVWTNTCQTHHVTCGSTFDLGGHGTGFYAPAVLKVSNKQAFQFGRYDALPLSALVGLVTLTFDLMTSK